MVFAHDRKSDAKERLFHILKEAWLTVKWLQQSLAYCAPHLLRFHLLRINKYWPSLTFCAVSFHLLRTLLNKIGVIWLFFGKMVEKIHAIRVQMAQIDQMSAFSLWQRPLQHLKNIDMIFWISILLSLIAHFRQIFVFLYFCSLLSLSAHFKNLERFTTCMLSHLLRFHLVRTFFRTLHAQ